jgi:rhomboid protease GluP
VVLSPGVGAALVYAAILVICYAAQASRSYGFDWVSAGSADAAMMRVGQWWRAVTALTLHADVQHLGGNMLFGALFGVVLAQSVGAGLAWLTFVVAGGAGNLLNLTIQPIDHGSLGASTGVFGLLGAQVAFDWFRRGRVRHSRLRRMAPLVMGVALVAWLGNGGEHIDVGAHAFGFLAGLVCGAAPGWRLPSRLVTARAQEVTGLVAIALVGVAWYLALRP